MKCRDVMKTDIVFCTGDESIVDCARKMRDRNVGFVPVVDQEKRVLGTLTDRDITIRCVAENRPPQQCFVKEIMTRQTVACRAEDDLGVAERIMSQHQKSRILCTDQNGTLEGVISLSDIAQKEKDKATADVLRSVSQREVRM